MFLCKNCPVQEFVSTKGAALSVSDTLPICQRMSESVAGLLSERRSRKENPSTGFLFVSQSKTRPCLFASLEAIRRSYETEKTSQGS